MSAGGQAALEVKVMDHDVIGAADLMGSVDNLECRTFKIIFGRVNFF